MWKRCAQIVSLNKSDDDQDRLTIIINLWSKLNGRIMFWKKVTEWKSNVWRKRRSIEINQGLWMKTKNKGRYLVCYFYWYCLLLKRTRSNIKIGHKLTHTHTLTVYRSVTWFIFINRTLSSSDRNKNGRGASLRFENRQNQWRLWFFIL